MSEVILLGEYYFSQLQDKPVFDADKRKMGRIRDMAVRWDGMAPCVVGIKYAKDKPDLIPIEFIEKCDVTGVYVKGEYHAGKSIPISENEYYIGKWLLDQQLIDLQGYRLVRVNDITLAWTSHDDFPRFVLRAVDIGTRGLFRRLGVEFLFTQMENRLLGWEYIKPRTDRNSALQVVREKQQLEQLHPADIADIIEELDYRRRNDLINRLDAQLVVDAFAEMDLETQVEIMEQLDEKRASDILEEMAPDDAADLLGELPEDKSEELLGLLESEDAHELRTLMQYEENTAGALMTTEYISFSQDLTAEQAINTLRELAPDAETIYYIFITDERDYLQGVMSLRELIIANPQSILRDMMRTNIITVSHLDSGEEVADTFNKYSLIAVPVVDERRVLLGIITVDDVLDMLMPERNRADASSWFHITQHSKRGWQQ